MQIQEKDSALAAKHCVPCQGGVPILTPDEVSQLRQQIAPAWSLTVDGHLFRAFIFADFMGPVALANRIAELAESEGHHPDLNISWGRLGVELWTHKVGGLTESDFILAAKMDQLGER